MPTDDNRPLPRRQEPARLKKKSNLPIVLALAGGGVFLLVGSCGVGGVLLWKKNSGAAGGVGGILASGPSKPKGARLDERTGGDVDDPAVVDEAWARLQGKWELLPNPDLRVTLEFNSDYTITRTSTIRSNPTNRGTEKAALVYDRSLTLAGGPPGSKVYVIQYETGPNTLYSESFIVQPDGLIVTVEGRFRRVSGGPAAPRSAEDVIWSQLIGSDWEGHRYYRFGPDRTVTVWKSELGGGRGAVQMQGQVTGIRILPNGRFVVLLGPHRVDGRLQPKGELGEFYFGGGGGWLTLNRADKPGGLWAHHRASDLRK
jgi:hypothetical protein